MSDNKQSRRGKYFIFYTEALGLSVEDFDPKSFQTNVKNMLQSKYLDDLYENIVIIANTSTPGFTGFGESVSQVKLMQDAEKLVELNLKIFKEIFSSLVKNHDSIKYGISIFEIDPEIIGKQYCTVDDTKDINSWYTTVGYPNFKNNPKCADSKMFINVKKYIAILEGITPTRSEKYPISYLSFDYETLSDKDLQIAWTSFCFTMKTQLNLKIGWIGGKYFDQQTMIDNRKGFGDTFGKLVPYANAPGPPCGCITISGNTMICSDVKFDKSNKCFKPNEFPPYSWDFAQYELYTNSTLQLYSEDFTLLDLDSSKTPNYWNTVKISSFRRFLDIYTTSVSIDYKDYKDNILNLQNGCYAGLTQNTIPGKPGTAASNLNCSSLCDSFNIGTFVLTGSSVGDTIDTTNSNLYNYPISNAWNCIDERLSYTNVSELIEYQHLKKADEKQKDIINLQRSVGFYIGGAGGSGVSQTDPPGGASLACGSCICKGTDCSKGPQDTPKPNITWHLGSAISPAIDPNKANPSENVCYIYDKITTTKKGFEFVLQSEALTTVGGSITLNLTDPESQKGKDILPYFYEQKVSTKSFPKANRFYYGRAGVNKNGDCKNQCQRAGKPVADGILLTDPQDKNKNFCLCDGNGDFYPDDFCTNPWMGNHFSVSDPSVYSGKATVRDCITPLGFTCCRYDFVNPITLPGTLTPTGLDTVVNSIYLPANSLYTCDVDRTSKTKFFNEKGETSELSPQYYPTGGEIKWQTFAIQSTANCYQKSIVPGIENEYTTGGACGNIACSTKTVDCYTFIQESSKGGTAKGGWSYGWNSTKLPSTKCTNSKLVLEGSTSPANTLFSEEYISFDKCIGVNIEDQSIVTIKAPKSMSECISCDSPVKSYEAVYLSKDTGLNDIENGNKPICVPSKNKNGMFLSLNMCQEAIKGIDKTYPPYSTFITASFNNLAESKYNNSYGAQMTYYTAGIKRVFASNTNQLSNSPMSYEIAAFYAGISIKKDKLKDEKICYSGKSNDNTCTIKHYVPILTKPCKTGKGLECTEENLKNDWAAIGPMCQITWEYYEYSKNNKISGNSVSMDIEGINDRICRKYQGNPDKPIDFYKYCDCETIQGKNICNDKNYISCNNSGPNFNSSSGGNNSFFLWMNQCWQYNLENNDLSSQKKSGKYFENMNPSLIEQERICEVYRSSIEIGYNIDNNTFNDDYRNQNFNFLPLQLKNISEDFIILNKNDTNYELYFEFIYTNRNNNKDISFEFSETYQNELYKNNGNYPSLYYYIIKNNKGKNYPNKAIPCQPTDNTSLQCKLNLNLKDILMKTEDGYYKEGSIGVSVLYNDEMNNPITPFFVQDKNKQSIFVPWLLDSRNKAQSIIKTIDNTVSQALGQTVPINISTCPLEFKGNELIYCSGNGTCDKTTQKCKCNPGYFGEYCKKNINPSESMCKLNIEGKLISTDCGASINQGKCNEKTGLCECYSNARDPQIGCCPRNGCNSPNGSCIYSRGVCTCNNDYTGIQCNEPVRWDCGTGRKIDVGGKIDPICIVSTNGPFTSQNECKEKWKKNGKCYINYEKHFGECLEGYGCVTTYDANNKCIYNNDSKAKCTEYCPVNDINGKICSGRSHGNCNRKHTHWSCSCLPGYTFGNEKDCREVDKTNPRCPFDLPEVIPEELSCNPDKDECTKLVNDYLQQNYFDCSSEFGNDPDNPYCPKSGTCISSTCTIINGKGRCQINDRRKVYKCDASNNIYISDYSNMTNNVNNNLTHTREGIYYVCGNCPKYNGYLCNNNGICNQQTSNCECYEGFTGLSCEKKIENEAKKIIVHSLK